MNWKGYVQIIPTENQINRMDQVVKRADDFLSNTEEHSKLIISCVCTEQRSHWVFWKKVIETLDPRKVSKSSPLGVSWYVWTDGDYFYRDEDYDIMKDIQQMIQAGSPLYLDNEMVKVWNKVLLQDI